MSQLLCFLFCGLSTSLGLSIIREGPLDTGYLPATEEIQHLKAETLCECSAICFARPACASVSYAADSATCQLFRSVASRRALLADPARAYRFVAERRSGHHQFCASDAGCLAAGDLCRGRLCQAESSLTCRDLQDVHGVSESGVHWGAVQGRSLKLYCDMEHDGGGWTLLLAGVGEGWNASSALWRPAADEPGLDTPYSIYNLSDAIRDSRRRESGLFQNTFEVDVYDRVAFGGGHWRMSRAVSLLRSAPGLVRLSALDGRFYNNWSLLPVLPTPPWLAAEATDGDVLITVHPVMKRVGRKLPQAGVVLGSRPHQQVWGGGQSTGRVVLLIREY